jgi:hypothetical protein
MNPAHMSRVPNIVPLMVAVLALGSLLTVALFWSMFQ